MLENNEIGALVADGGCGHQGRDAQVVGAAASTPIPSSAPVADGDGHAYRDTRAEIAVSTPSPAPKRGRPRKATITPTPNSTAPSSAPTTETAGNGGGEDRASLQLTSSGQAPDLSHTIAALQELQFRRSTYIREVNALNNRVRAMIRRALGWQWDLPEKERTALNKRAAKIQKDVETGKALSDADTPVGSALMADVLVFAAARAPLDSARGEVEREMRRLARALPVWTGWAESVRGFGELGMAVVVAEAGDVGSYATVSRLWKRLGLAVINGERQQRKSEKELAAEHGYNPRRRAEMFAFFGDAMFRGQWRGESEDSPALSLGPYGAVYAREKAKALPRIEATASLSGKEKWTAKRVDNHARRLMTKAVIRDLWRVWRGMLPRGSAPAELDDMPNANPNGEEAREEARVSGPPQPQEGFRLIALPPGHQP